MGMAASQARLLQLTDRNNTIGRKLIHCSNQKMALSRDMRKISDEYQNALKSKVLKWSNSNGANYLNITYHNLMTPSEMNQNMSYLLTDLNGRIVISDNYKDFAEIISPDGKPNPNWESNRYELLEKATGISASEIQRYEDKKEEVWELEEAVIKLNNDSRQDNHRFVKTGLNELLKKMTVNPSPNFNKKKNWVDAYKDNDTISISSGEKGIEQLSNILNGISDQLSEFFGDDKETFEKYCKGFISTVQKSITEGKKLSDQKDDNGGTTNEVSIVGDGSGYTIRVQNFLNELFGFIGSQLGFSEPEDVQWIDIDAEGYDKWLKNYHAWEDEFQDAKNTYNDAVAELNEIFTAENERAIEFYDNLFSSIAEKGWTYNYNVEDEDYLNQMLQNNMFLITTVDRKEVVDYRRNSNGDLLGCDLSFKNDYSSDIASNFQKIYQVSDNEVKNDALVKYEAAKARINSKETIIDTRMQNLQTEQSAIKQMIQSIESQRNKNIESFFNVMG